MDTVDTKARPSLFFCSTSRKQNDMHLSRGSWQRCGLLRVQQAFRRFSARGLRADQNDGEMRYLDAKVFGKEKPIFGLYYGF